ncbi:MAG: ABC-2 transporter permease [Peptoniphilaceae bacterium]
MKAILLNDYYLLKRDIKRFLISMLLAQLYPIISLIKGDINPFIIFIFFLVATFVLNSMTYQTIYCDEQNLLLEYIKASPISNNDYVNAKYILASIIMAAIALLTSLVIYILIKDIEYLIRFLLLDCLILIFTYLTIALVFRYGYSKISIVIMASFLIIFFGTIFLIDILKIDPMILVSSKAMYYMMPLALVITFLSYIFFKKLALKFIEEAKQ